MSSRLFADDPAAVFGEFFGMGWPEPPESVPLRILGLGSVPANRDVVKSAFRAKVMAAHPDLASYTIPAVREAAEAIVAATSLVQELVWARDVLLRKIPAPVTAETCAREQHQNPSRAPKRCKGCEGVWSYDGGDIAYFVKRGQWTGYCEPCARKAANAQRREIREWKRANRTCKGCGEKFTPPRADGRYCSAACRQRAYRKRRATP